MLSYSSVGLLSYTFNYRNMAGLPQDMKSLWTRITAQVFPHSSRIHWHSLKPHCTIPGSFGTPEAGSVPRTAKSALNNSQGSRMSYSAAHAPS